MASKTVCPHCGRCSACGQPRPWPWVYPVTQPAAPYVQPYTVPFTYPTWLVGGNVC